VASRTEQFQALVTRDPGNPMFRFSLAQALVAEGRGAEAVEHYEFCVHARADWMMPRILLGKLLLQLNRRSEARAMLSAALELAVAQQHEEPEHELQALLAELERDPP